MKTFDSDTWKELDEAEMVLARPEAEWREAKSMKRLTSDNTFEMNMHQLALNQVYIGKDGWARYVEGPDRECSVCDLARAVSETLGAELPMLGDEALSDLLLDWLQYGAEEPEGVVAILYRALCAMAEVRAQLFRYEDTGLEPEEIETAKERIDIKFALWVSKTWGLADGRLNEILKAEKDGRLVVLGPNDPLTLEELRDMDGEPVWIVEYPDWGHWELSADAEDYVQDRNEEFYGMKHDDKDGKFGLHLLGWLAYRRKPEEAAP